MRIVSLDVPQDLHHSASGKVRGINRYPLGADKLQNLSIVKVSGY